MEAIAKAERALQREINFTVFGLDEWKQRIIKKRAFTYDVYKNKKIFIIGTEDELRAITEKSYD